MIGVTWWVGRIVPLSTVRKPDSYLTPPHKEGGRRGIALEIWPIWQKNPEVWKMEDSQIEKLGQPRVGVQTDNADTQTHPTLKCKQLKGAIK